MRHLVYPMLLLITFYNACTAHNLKSSSNRQSFFSSHVAFNLNTDNKRFHRWIFFQSVFLSIYSCKEVLTPYGLTNPEKVIVFILQDRRQLILIFCYMIHFGHNTQKMNHLSLNYLFVINN